MYAIILIFKQYHLFRLSMTEGGQRKFNLMQIKSNDAIFMCQNMLQVVTSFCEFRLTVQYFYNSGSSPHE